MKDKKRLQRIGKKCVDLANEHREMKVEFEKLFKEIYGIDFDEQFDDTIDAVDYGNSLFSVEDLEKEIIFLFESCNYNIDKSNLKNVNIENKDEVLE